MRSRPPSSSQRAVEVHRREQVLERVLPLAGEREQAAECVVRRGVVRLGLKALLERGAVVAARDAGERDAAEHAPGLRVGRMSRGDLRGALDVALVARLDQQLGELERGATVVGIERERLLEVEARRAEVAPRARACVPAAAA